MVNGVFTIPENDHREMTGQAVNPLDPSALQPSHPYIAGPENALLRAAVDSLAETTPRFTPLLLTGAPGVGKTLAMECLATVFHGHHPAVTSYVTTGADFTRDVADAIELDSLSDFRSRYQGCSLIVLDGIHELADKAYAHAELRHLLDTSIQDGMHCLLSSRFTTGELPFPTDLRSRLSAGVEISLRSPGPEATREIVNTLAYDVSADVRDALATAESVIEIKQRLNEVVARCSDNQGRIDERAALKLLRAKGSHREIDPDAISKCVAKYFRLQTSQLRGPSRRHTIVQARAMAIYLIREQLGLSYQEIGRCFGNRDHTTVLHAYRRVDQQADDDPTMRQALADLREELRSSTRRGKRVDQRSAQPRNRQSTQSRPTNSSNSRQAS